MCRSARVARAEDDWRAPGAATPGAPKGRQKSENGTMVGRKLHSSGLVPKSLSAQVLDFIAEGGLGLLGLAAAADVVSADCRLNHWIATYLKGTDQSEEKWLELLDEIEKD